MREDHRSYIRNFCRLGKESLKKNSGLYGTRTRQQHIHHIQHKLYTIISYECRHYRELTNKCFNFLFRLPKITLILNVTLTCTTDMRL